LSAGRVLHRWPGAHQAGKVACAPDGRSVVTSDTILRHWDVATGRPLYADVGPLGHVKSVRRLFFTPDGQRLASVGLDGTIRVWDVPGAKPVHTINIGDTNLNTGILPSEGALLTWTLTPDGANLIAVDDRLNIHRWSVADGQPRPGFQLKEARDLNIRSRARQIRVAPDGQTLAVTIPPGGYDRLRYSFSSWDLKTGRLRSWGGDVERGFNGEYSMLSPDVRWAAERGKLYDTQTGRQVLSLPGGGQQRYVIGEVFSPDSRLLAEPAENLRVWEIATGGLLIDVPGTDTTLASFSPDGRRFAYADRSRLVVWDLPTRKLVLERPAPELLRRDGWVTGGVAFAPDGRTVATGHRDGTILIWEVPPVEEVRLSERELAALWNDLADDSPAQAYAAVWRLGQDPDAAARFLGQMPRPVVLPTDAEWRALIRNLNSDRFAEREAASRRLRELGRAAEDVLRQSLKDKPTPEQQRRIEVLLAALNPAGPPQGDNLRAVRAVAVLENINTAAARQVLTRWAEQSPNPWLAGEASRALARQKWRPVLGTRR
jgi:WD40 repeat protein